MFGAESGGVVGLLSGGELQEQSLRLKVGWRLKEGTGHREAWRNEGLACDFIGRHATLTAAAGGADMRCCHLPPADLIFTFAGVVNAMRYSASKGEPWLYASR